MESEIVWPVQNGPPFDGAGVAGRGLTTTLVVPDAEGQPLTVTVTEYVPALAVVAFVRVGFCNEDVKPFGPVQAYVAPVTAAVEREMADPSQNGPPFEGVGVTGIGLTVTVIAGAGALRQAFAVVVTV